MERPDPRSSLRFASWQNRRRACARARARARRSGPPRPGASPAGTSSASRPAASCSPSSAALASSSISPSILRRSRFRRSSCCAQLAARASSSVSRHSMPRPMSARRPAAFRRGPRMKPRSKQFALRRLAPAGARERGEPRLALPGAQALQPLRDEDPVVRVQRHHVGDGAERDQVGEGGEVGFGFVFECFSISQFRPESQHHVEHHADAGDRLRRKAAAGLVRIHDALGLGQRVAGQVVVGDQRADAEAASRAPRPRRWRCRCPP